MSSRTRHRPQRGDDNAKVFVSGDTGIFGGPQGGAEPGATESGDLDARQYGVPQADIPGGVRHLVNPETHPAATVDKGVRPTDYHKHHGVPPTEGGEYVTPDPTVGPPIPSAQPYKSIWHEAVPVRVVEGRDANGRPLIRTLYSEGPVVIAAATVDPIRLADRDFHRTKLWICNETTPNPAGSTGPGIRIGDYETCADNRGLLLPAGVLRDFNSQDSVYVTNQSGAAVTLSWGYETEIAASGE